MISAPADSSQRNLSADISSGRIATDWQPKRDPTNTPPRQKFPVLGQTALWRVGSNSPEISRGTRHPKAAPTLWQPVGKCLPTSPTMRADTPVNSVGNSIQLPPLNAPPSGTDSFFHVMRKRLAGSGSESPVPPSRSMSGASAPEGSFIWANVGTTMPSSRQCWAVFFRIVSEVVVIEAPAWC